MPFVLIYLFGQPGKKQVGYKTFLEFKLKLWDEIFISLFLLLVFAALEDEATADYKRKFITLEIYFNFCLLIINSFNLNYPSFKFRIFPKYFFLLFKDCTSQAY